MNQEEYVRKAMRTDADYDAVRERLKQYPGFTLEIFEALRYGILTGKMQTELKRALIYGKGNLPAASPEPVVLPDGDSGGGLLRSNPRALRLLHMLLGCLTEAAEMQEQLFEVIFKGAEVDIPYLKGELGDLSWFQAGMCDELGLALAEVQESNVRKLMVRFPQGFSEARGTDAERDLEGEAAALKEGGECR